MTETCAKCNSDKLIFDALAIDRADYNAEGILNLAVDEKFVALIFRQRTHSAVSTVVCGACGYIEFYADNPEALYLASRNRLKNTE